jgi:ribosomal protein S18 acetylase RimI-like enzyme
MNHFIGCLWHAFLSPNSSGRICRTENQGINALSESVESAEFLEFIGFIGLDRVEKIFITVYLDPLNQKDVDIAMPGSEAESKKKGAIVRVRPMEVDDLAPVFHLGEALFTASRAPNLYRTWDEFEVVGLFQSDWETCFVAELNDVVVGFALGTIITKTHSAWKYGHLIWLGVAPQHARKGVGERLFRQFRDVTSEEGVRMLIVDTEADNLPALRFFRKMGFGNPQEHIYLALNLAGRQRGAPPSRKNGPVKRPLKEQ